MRENAGKWESASPRDLERIDALARAIVNRLLHDPTARLKELRDDRVHARMALVRDLFGWRSRRATSARASAPSRAGLSEDERARRGPRASTAVDPDRHARQRAGARAGESGGGAPRMPRPSWSTITTAGDRGAAVQDKSRWVSELERRCSTAGSTSRCTPPRTCPRELADGLELVAIPQRADPRDAICGAPFAGGAQRRCPGWHEQPAPRGADPGRARGSRGRSSVRGNVDTRLRKLDRGPVRRARAGARGSAAARSRRRGRRAARRARAGGRPGRAGARGARRRAAPATRSSR